MDWRRINFAMDYVASSGTVFSVEQRLAMQASLTILQQENQFQQLHFVGRILGTESDYWIVCGLKKEDLLKEREFFYSKNLGMDWIKLPEVAEEVIELGLSCRGHFTGDPSADSETDFAPSDLDELGEEEGWVTIKEQERLAATVTAIMNDCALVPRGALLKQATGHVYENKMFEGLSKLDASQYHSYYHFRRPENAFDRNIVIRADYNLSMDFLDSIAVDLPVGCWSVKLDRLETTATLQSLYWPGFFGFHQIGTPNYGWIYIGPGKKNWDVPFMIAPLPKSARLDVVEGEDVPIEIEEVKAQGEADIDLRTETAGEEEMY